MGASEKALHVLLEADGLHKKSRTAWVDRLEPVGGDKKQWKMAPADIAEMAQA